MFHTEDTKSSGITHIKDVRPGMKNLKMKIIVLQVNNPYKTKDGNEVRSCKVADKSGSVNISIWGDDGNYVQPGDILQITRGYGTLFKNCLTLYVGKGGTLIKTGEFCFTFNEVPDMSEPNQEWIQQAKDKAAQGPADPRLQGGGAPHAIKPPQKQKS